MSLKSKESDNRHDIETLPTASTLCRDCIFADYKDNIQIGCNAGRIEKFHNANISMAELDYDDTISVVIEGKTCVYYRPKEWAISHYTTSSVPDILQSVKNELRIPYHAMVFVRGNNTIQDVKDRLLELQNQKIKPTIVTVIDRTHQEDIMSGELMKTLSQYHFKHWKIHTIQATDQLDSDIIDIVYDTTKSIVYMFYMIFECDYSIPSSMSEEIHKSLHDDMKVFSVLLPNKNKIGGGALKVAHAKHGGNSFSIPLEDKIKYYNDSPHLIKQVEEICPSLQT